MTNGHCCIVAQEMVFEVETFIRNVMVIQILLKDNSTILKVKGSEFIFGGFTTVNWDSSNGWKSDLNAFIFSLTNKDNKPVKMKIEQNRHQYAFCCYSFLWSNIR